MISICAFVDGSAPPLAAQGLYYRSAVETG